MAWLQNNEPGVLANTLECVDASSTPCGGTIPAQGALGPKLLPLLKASLESPSEMMVSHPKKSQKHEM